MHVRSIKNHKERMTVARWAAETFEPHSIPRSIRFWTQGLPREPGYRPERQRVVEDKGKLVSHLRIADRNMQMGLATLRMGGLGAVVTPPKQRGRGYARALLQDTTHYLTTQGFDLGCLDGVADFYHRFGYATVMPYHHVRIQVQDALALASPLSVRPLTPEDVQELASLYERCWHRRVGVLVRDKAMWQWQLDGIRGGDVVVGASGDVRGYVVYEREADWAKETAATDANAVAALLRRLAQRAQQAGKQTFYLNLPPDAPFVRLARAMCAIKIIASTRPGAGWQARLLNVESAFDKLSPELSERLARAPQTGWHGRLRLETEIGGVSLYIDRTGVRVDKETRTQIICLMPQARLTQLLFGYITVAEAAAAPGSSIPYVASPIMAALFPPTSAYIVGLDWF